jgi:hypothetical protein
VGSDVTQQVPTHVGCRMQDAGSAYLPPTRAQWRLSCSLTQDHAPLCCTLAPSACLSKRVWPTLLFHTSHLDPLMPLSLIPATARPHTHHHPLDHNGTTTFTLAGPLSAQSRGGRAGGATGTAWLRWQPLSSSSSLSSCPCQWPSLSRRGRS